MKNRYHFILLVFVLGISLLSCNSTSHSGLEIDDSVYFTYDGEAKVKKYLRGLSANSVEIITASSYDEEQEELYLSVYNSRKVYGKSREKIETISNLIAKVLCKSISYPEGYRDLTINFVDINEDEESLYFYYGVDSVLNSWSTYSVIEGDAYKGQFTIAEKHFQDLQFEEAIGNLNHILEYNPNWEEAIKLRAEALFELGYYTEAIDDYNSLISINKNNHQYFYLKGKALFQLEWIESAREALEESIFLTDSSHYETFMLMGDLDLYDEDYLTAVIHFSKAIQLDSESQEAYLGRSGAYFQLDETSKGCEDLHQADKLGPLTYGQKRELLYCPSIQNP